VLEHRAFCFNHHSTTPSLQYSVPSFCGAKRSQTLMRVSLNWLKEFVEIDLPPDDLADVLTMAGLEVESREPLGRSLQDVVAGRILSVGPHPRSDKALFLCDVDTGRGVFQVVCGAPNVEIGMMAPMALPGAALPGGVRVKESRIRGEVSMGMLLAEDEMGLTDDHTGLMVLPADLTPGTPVAEALCLEDDALEIAITPNRADCTSVIGIAREIAALTGQPLRKPEIRLKESDKNIHVLTSVTIDDPTGCARYAAGVVLGLELRASPFWMRYRLMVSGIRAISNVVDVTNYVLLELGQPLHAFDYDRLKENRIVVRRAREGETFTTLDGKTHPLNAENLMICDAQRAVALAGIMGGLNSEIYLGSRNVLVESAFFDPVTIRRGAKRLGISTEASYRFERGIDIDGVVTALRRSIMLMSELAGGEVVNGIIDNYPNPRHRPVITLRADKTNRFLGTNLSGRTMARYLTALEMDVSTEDEDTLRVKPPAFRVDVTRDWDLMEEVARLEGYQKIPVTFPPIKASGELDPPEVFLGDQVREIMVGMGFSEIISYSFVSPVSADQLQAQEGSPLRSFVGLLNPLTVEQSVMRTSLIPGLMAAAGTNFAHGEKDLRCFEWGRVFVAQGGDRLPWERYFLAAFMTGLANKKAWHTEERPVDFYDIKGVVEGVLEGLGLASCSFQREETPPWYRADSAACVTLNGVVLGALGELSSDVLKRFDLDETRVFLFELDGNVLLDHASPKISFKPFAKFPAALRDVSLVVEKDVECGQIQEIIEREGGQLVESVTLFDLYEGGKIGHAEKALAFRICYRSKETTLDGRDINRLHERIIEKVGKETGARLRES
jgi:phenylalanyl-tRNA synthetase beta chain